MCIFKTLFSNLLIALAFCLSCSCSPTLPPTSISSEHNVVSPLQNLYQSVVVIMGIKDNNIKAIGSGVVIRCEKGQKKRVITAWHVVDYLNYIKSPILAGSKKTGKIQVFSIVKPDPANDLGILEGLLPEKEACPTAPIARDLPEVGDAVYVVGEPMGHEGNISKGILSNVYVNEAHGGATMVYRTDAAVAPGNSGGGMFNSKGELIGIISFLELLPGFPLVPVPVPGSGHAIGLPHIWLNINSLAF